MLQAFVITLREGLEAFLIVAISLAYLRKSGRHQLIPAVHWASALTYLLVLLPMAWLLFAGTFGGGRVAPVQQSAAP